MVTSKRGRTQLKRFDRNKPTSLFKTKGAKWTKPENRARFARCQSEPDIRRRPRLGAKGSIPSPSSTAPPAVSRRLQKKGCRVCAARRSTPSAEGSPPSRPSAGNTGLVRLILSSSHNCRRLSLACFGSTRVLAASEACRIIADILRCRLLRCNQTRTDCASPQALFTLSIVGGNSRPGFGGRVPRV